jgi:HNH endonuclease
MMAYHYLKSDIAPAGQRTCKNCGQIKALDDFPAHSNSKNGVVIWRGHRVQCKECDIIRNAARFQRRKEVWQPRRTAWYLNNYEKSAWTRTCTRARRLGATEFLSFDEWRALKSATVCHWCNFALHPSFTHVDHVRPLAWGGQHTRDNLVMSCANCNVRRAWEMQTKYQKGR